MLPAWPRNVRVGANSPSLWPTMFSVTYTGINLLPLCTAKVCPTNSGEIIDARDHVLITDFLPDASMAATFLSSFTLIYGPFFNERLMLLSIYQITFSFFQLYTSKSVSSELWSSNLLHTSLFSIWGVHLMHDLHHHPSGDLQGSSRHHGCEDDGPTSASVRLYPSVRGRDPSFLRCRSWLYRLRGFFWFLQKVI